VAITVESRFCMNIAQATTSGTRTGRRAGSDRAVVLFQRNNDNDVSGVDARMTALAARSIYPLFPEKR
jgi:hypothetical protein